MKRAVFCLLGNLLFIACIEPSTYTGPEGFVLNVSDMTFRLNEGSSTSIPLQVSRGEARDEEIIVEVSGLPSGVTAEPLRIEQGKSDGVLVLHAAGALIGSEFTTTLTAIGRGLTMSATAKVFVAGRPGTLDMTFGENGRRSIPTLGVMEALPSGGFLLAGELDGVLTLAKVTVEGVLDTSFGNGGFVSAALPGGLRSISTQVIEQPDSKILLMTSLDDPATGTRPDSLVISRWMKNGTIDQSYGSAGYATDAVPNRTYGAAIGIEGELLLWNGAAQNSRLTRVLPNGTIGSSSTVIDEDDLVHVGCKMIVQPDGKVVIPAYEPPGLKPALIRFDTALRMDPSFGREGKQALSLSGFSLRALPDGSYVTVGFRGDPGEPAVMRFDPLWRPLPGFNNGAITFPHSGAIFLASVSVDGATLAAGHINNAVRVGRVLDTGMIDKSYGVDGLSQVAFMDSLDGIQGMVLAPPFGAMVVISRGASRSTDIIRIWQ